MDIFSYVMVLVSMIVALSITQLLSGFGRLITSPTPLKSGAVHLAWCVWLLVFLTFFWWWEYGLREVTPWTFGVYLLVVAYATLLYFMSVILMPDQLPADGDLERAFLSRRYWFFGLALAGQGMDVFDTLAKGDAHVQALGWSYWVVLCSNGTAYCMGLLSRNRRVQLAAAALAFVGFMTFAFSAFRTAA